MVVAISAANFGASRYTMPCHLSGPTPQGSRGWNTIFTAVQLVMYPMNAVISGTVTSRTNVFSMAAASEERRGVRCWRR